MNLKILSLGNILNFDMFLTKQQLLIHDPNKKREVNYQSSFVYFIISQQTSQLQNESIQIFSTKEEKPIFQFSGKNQ